MGLCSSGQQRGTHLRQRRSLQVDGTKLLIHLSYKTAGGVDGIVGMHRGEESRVQSLSWGMQREVLLPFPILLVRLWLVHTAPSQSLLLQLCCLSFFLCLSSFCVCASKHHLPLFWLPPPLLPAPGSYAPRPSVSLCACFLLFFHGVQVLTGIALRLEGETGFLVSFPGIQGAGSRVVLEVFFWSFSMWPEQASRCLGTLGPGRGPEKLAHVQWRLNLQRTGLPYFTELS